MKATLYTPFQLPQAMPTSGLSLPNPETGFASIPDNVSVFLGCSQALVDILTFGTNYVVYTVFDHDGDINKSAMLAVAEVAGEIFGVGDEDSHLCGPVLIVRA
jgi:hypothetical protein